MTTAKSAKTLLDKAAKQANTKVNTDYKPGAYAAQNTNVEQRANTNAQNGAKQAETAYQLAASNNASRAAQSNAQNNTVTKQIGNTMRKAGYSLTNRNVAGAASARSASTISGAQTNANRNAELARETAKNKSAQSAYQLEANAKARNVEADISRSTQQSKTKAQQSYQAAENKKSRQIKTAKSSLDEDIDKRKRKLERQQRQEKSYADTVATRYQSVKSVDKAIKKLRASKSKTAKTKLAYLEALRAQLAGKKSGGSGGSGGRRGGGRRYGRRYGSGGGSGKGGDIPEIEGQRSTPEARNVLKEIGIAGGYIGQAGRTYGDLARQKKEDTAAKKRLNASKSISKKRSKNVTRKSK